MWLNGRWFCRNLGEARAIWGRRLGAWDGDVRVMTLSYMWMHVAWPLGSIPLIDLLHILLKRLRI